MVLLSEIDIRYTSNRPIVRPELNNLDITYYAGYRNPSFDYVLGDAFSEFSASNPMSGPVLSRVLSFESINAFTYFGSLFEGDSIFLKGADGEAFNQLLTNNEFANYSVSISFDANYLFGSSSNKQSLNITNDVNVKDPKVKAEKFTKNDYLSYIKTVYLETDE